MVYHLHWIAVFINTNYRTSTCSAKLGSGRYKGYPCQKTWFNSENSQAIFTILAIFLYEVGSPRSLVLFLRIFFLFLQNLLCTCLKSNYKSQIGIWNLLPGYFQFGSLSIISPPLRNPHWYSPNEFSLHKVDSCLIQLNGFLTSQNC